MNTSLYSLSIFLKHHHPQHLAFAPHFSPIAYPVPPWEFIPLTIFAGSKCDRTRGFAPNPSAIAPPSPALNGANIKITPPAPLKTMTQLFPPAFRGK